MTYPIELDIDRIKRDYKWSDYSQQAKDDIETLVTELETTQDNIIELLEYIKNNNVNFSEEVVSISKQYSFSLDKE